MATHYPHRAGDGNKQGLHYNGFRHKPGDSHQSGQTLARVGWSKIGKSGVESAK
jgi:hypothetical protein